MQTHTPGAYSAASNTKTPVEPLQRINLNARELRSQEAEISIRGSGDVAVWTIASLDVTVTGSGDIEYYGDPQVSQRIHGSGNVERRGGVK